MSHDRRSSSIFSRYDKFSNWETVPSVKTAISGYTLAKTPKYNKGTGFTLVERHQLHLDGLLPYKISTMEEQEKRILWNISKRQNRLEKYSYFMTLLERNERLFYHTLINNIQELMPIVYTPTVGEACQRFGHIFNQPRCLWITLAHKNRIRFVLENWPESDIRAIVFTDGERILGLGDLGALGMGIPIGKLALYTACAGIPPEYLLPVLIDVGTDNEELLNSDMYIGIQKTRERGQIYDELIEEFMQACTEKYGESCLLQFEDFGNRNALRLLNKFKTDYCCFNDDIQGTAGVGLAGIYASLRISGLKLSQHVFLFLGSGSAGIGIADLIANSIARDENTTLENGRKNIWLFDSRGLIVMDRSTCGITDAKLPFAHKFKELTNFQEAIKALKATCIIGVSSQPKSFTEGVIRAVAKNTERPLIFPMSNPTVMSECTAEEAYNWTDNRCIFASGSPFPPLSIKLGNNEIAITPSQGNNSYIFPGLALGIVYSRAKRVCDPDFLLIAAKCLANQVTQEGLDKNEIFPKLQNIRQVSVNIAVEIAKEVFKRNLSCILEPKNIREDIEKFLYVHETYESYVCS